MPVADARDECPGTWADEIMASATGGPLLLNVQESTSCRPVE